MLRKWSSSSGELNLHNLIHSLGMQLWGRKMPRANELLRVRELATLYLAESTNLRFSEVEMVNGMRFLNGSLEDKYKFLPSGLEDVEARRLAGIVMNTLARVRDLLVPEKYSTCIKNASEAQVLEVRNMQKAVNSVHMRAIEDKPHSTLAATSDVDAGSPCSVPSILMQLACVSSSSPARSRSAASSPAGSPCGLSALLRQLHDASARGANRRPRVGCTSYQSRGDL